jgi:hypothetical protein
MLLLVLVVASGCLPGRLVFRSGPFRGNVIDAETRQPLIGAAVHVHWNREAAVVGAAHGTEAFYDAVEVLTDANGEFTIPRQTFVTLWGEISRPLFQIYFPGYGPYPGFQMKPKGEALNSAFEEYTVVEMVRATTRAQREEYLLSGESPPGPDGKKRNTRRLANQERRALGLETFSDVEEPK